MATHSEIHTIPADRLSALQRRWENVHQENAELLYTVINDLGDLEEIGKRDQLYDEIPPILKREPMTRLTEFLGHMEEVCEHEPGQPPMQADVALFKDAVGIIAALMKETKTEQIDHLGKLLRPGKMEQSYRRRFDISQYASLSDKAERKIAKRIEKTRAEKQKLEGYMVQLDDFRKELIEVADLAGIDVRLNGNGHGNGHFPGGRV